MTDVLLYTFPQWLVFTALFGVIYGWIEEKKTFRMIGMALFIGLGIFSIYVLATDQLAPGNFLSPEEVASEELSGEIIDKTPLEARLFPAYLIFVVTSALALVTALLDFTNKKTYRLFTVLTGFISLLGFFIVVGAVRGF